MDNEPEDEGARSGAGRREPGRGAENPLDQRRARQDRGLNRFDEGEQPDPEQQQRGSEDDRRSVRSNGEGDLQFREKP